MFASMLKLVWKAYDYMQMTFSEPKNISRARVKRGQSWSGSKQFESLIVFPERICKKH